VVLVRDNEFCCADRMSGFLGIWVDGELNNQKKAGIDK
jgi:hypothetical protein